MKLLGIRCVVFFSFCFASTINIRAAVFTLTTSANGSGIVGRNPTNSVYPEGSVVTVTATPDAGWYFGNWSGDASGSGNPLNVPMTTDKTITAHFQPIPTYSLTILTNGNGSASLNPPGGSYQSNATVMATASPAGGWVFTGWTQDASGNANPLSINVNANKSVTAVFAQLPAIDVPPANVTTGVGESAGFSVQAVGTAPLRYQWWLQNNPLLNETNASLMLANLQPAQEGNYSVTVTNAYGTASASATLTLTNSCSGGNVVTEATEASLRAAMSLGGLVRICFNGTITLGSTIEVTKDVALDARDRSVIINGNNSVRLFKVSPGVTFSVTNLTLANGRHVGPNGANAGANPAEDGFPGEGGAIFNDGGTVRLVSSTVTSNSVLGGMGGTAAQPYPNNGVGGEGRGGAIAVRNGSLFLELVTISGNSATGGPGVLSAQGPAQGPSLGLGGDGAGGAVYVTNGSVMVANCTLSQNFSLAHPGGTGARSKGGALFQSSGSLDISNCLFLSNSALGSNAPSFLGNPGKPSSGLGGAIALAFGNVTISHSQFAMNLARGGNAYRFSGTGEAQGGAIFSGATLSASDSSFFGNQSLSGNFSHVNTDGRGGAIHNSGAAVFNRSSFYSNFAKGGDAGGFGSPVVDYPGGHGLGGSIFNIGQLAATNCTFALNAVQGGKGGHPDGVPGNGIGGGIYNINGSFTGMNITVASNSVAAGAGRTYQSNPDGANVANTNGTLALRNSLIAYPNTNGNATGVITDNGFNMSSDGSANFNSGSSFNFTDPRLEALANYGGPTFVMALRTNSPAIDFGTSEAAPATDQRGFLRPVGAGVDIGAYEFNPLQVDRPSLQVALTTTNVLLSFEAVANTQYRLQSSSALTNWTEIEVIGPFQNSSNVTRTISPAGQMTRFFRLTIP